MQTTKIWATPLAKKLIKERHVNPQSITPSGQYGEIKARDVLKVSAVKTTPAAKKLAAQLNIDLNTVSTGKRIRKEDVINYRAAQKAHGSVEMPSNAQVKPFTAMKRITGQRMAKTHSEVPPVTMHTHADVTALLKERTARNASGHLKLSLNDYVIHACAKALADSPWANTSYSPEGIVYKPDINIGVAVALEHGLIVPVIKNADRLTLEQISAKMKDLAQKARSGALSVDDCTGGTFTISNLGMYGITSFTPIINLPESLILGVCAVEKRVCLDEEGRLSNRDDMGLSITFDHRVHDGAQAAVFLKKIVDNLETGGKQE